jgi:hypothetical protein
MSSSLHDRLRGIVQGARPPVPVVSSDVQSPAPAPPTDAVAGNPSHVAAALGGRVAAWPEGHVVIVEREYPATARHGRAAIGELVETIQAGRDACATLGRAWPSAAGLADEDHPARMVFLDLETTGLAGGAGTHAFLVGCALLDRSSVHVRQFLLPGFEHERALLAEAAALLAAQGAVVTFNGRTFDLPLLETRYLFHRLGFPLDEAPHLDMLHAARRLWRARTAWAGADPDDESCSLAVLERRLAGVHRVGDVPGFEIPSRYFRFVRDHDARPLEAVLEHNRLDLVSLIALVARAILLIERGPSAASSAHESLGLARLYERAGSLEEAEGALLHTIEQARSVGVEPELHAHALARLARLRRRTSRPHEAAGAWQELATLARGPDTLRREACEALAIYHEHRSHDLNTARALVLDLLGNPLATHRRAAAEHRLRRLNRKIAVRKEGGLIAALDDADPAPS